MCADIHEMLNSSCSESRVSGESSISESDSDYNVSDSEAEFCADFTNLSLSRLSD